MYKSIIPDCYVSHIQENWEMYVEKQGMVYNHRIQLKQ